MKKLRIVELYAGTARSSAPFRRWHKCETALMVDNDEYAAKTYLKNYPDAPFETKDVSALSASRIKKLAGGRVDILLGCPPCQGFSDNGRRSPWDYRNRHLGHFSRIAQELRPAAIALENVPLAVITAQFQRFVLSLEDLGYLWTGGILNAALRGSAQCRQRLVFVAIRPDVGRNPEIPKPTHGGERKYFNYGLRKMTTLKEDPTRMLGITPATQRVSKFLRYNDFDFGPSQIPTLKEVLYTLPPIGSADAEKLSHRAWAHNQEQLRRMKEVPEGGRWTGAADHYSQTYGRLHRDGLARTITTAFPNGASGRFWHPSENRSLTLREAARIQGFPDSFRFIQPFSHAAFLVGNALDKALAVTSYRIIKSSLE